MTKLTSLIALFLLITTSLRASETFTPGPDGYIRHWLMLAPVIFQEGRSGTDLISDDQIRNEGALKPKVGDTVNVRGKELAWKAITASTNYFDFNAELKGNHDRALGYAVTYIECEQEMPGVIMALGSNDEGRLYLNGVDIYLFSEPRTLELDADKGRVTLKKGVNIVVFKIFNEQGNWQGAMRFLDKSGTPVTNFKIKLSP